MKDESPVASFIIPTYNEEKNIERTLLGIRNQVTTLPYEILVVDGQSEDRTVSIAQKSSIVIQSPERGKTFQVNYAVKQARGQILIFIDADTFLPDNYLNIIYNLFTRKKNLVACGAPFYYDWGSYRSFLMCFFTITAATNPFVFPVLLLNGLRANYLRKRKKPPLLNNYFVISTYMQLWYYMRGLLGYTELSGCNICVKREVFKQIGGFKELPHSKGIDAMFSKDIRAYIKKRRKGKLLILKNLLVFTNPRFITPKRMKQRIKQAGTIRKHYNPPK